MGPVLFSQSRTVPLPGGSQLSHSLSLGDVVTPLGSRTPSGVLFGFRPWLFARESRGLLKKYRANGFYKLPIRVILCVFLNPQGPAHNVKLHTGFGVCSIQPIEMKVRENALTVHPCVFNR